MPNIKINKAPNIIENDFKHCAIYAGNVIHKRFLPKKHHFNSSLYMLALDVETMERKPKSGGLFGFNWYHPLRFIEKDYLRDDPNTLSNRIKHKVNRLNGHADIQRVLMLVQVRCFGIYFSPANFYFCYDQHNKCTQMLAEVSNTPWNERHYYLIDLLEKEKPIISKKVFQVSPFMDLDMSYKWTITPPSKTDNKLFINIENLRTNAATGDVTKLFKASLVLRKQVFNKRNLLRIWIQLPVMTVKIVIGIYWQAMRLFLKKIPFIGYQKI